MCSFFVRASNPLPSRVYQNYHMSESVLFASRKIFWGKYENCIFSQRPCYYDEIEITDSAQSRILLYFVCVSQEYHLNSFHLQLLSDPSGTDLSFVFSSFSFFSSSHLALLLLFTTSTCSRPPNPYIF